MDRTRLQRLIIPNLTEILICAGLSISIIIISLHNALIAQLAKAGNIDSNTIKSILQQQFMKIANTTGLKIVIISLFIIGIFAFMYGAYRAIPIVEIVAENELAMLTNKRVKWWPDRLLQLGIVAALMIITLMSFKFFLPLWLDLSARTWFAGLSLLNKSGELIAGVGLTVNLITIWTFSKLFFAFPTLINNTNDTISTL